MSHSAGNSGPSNPVLETWRSSDGLHQSTVRPAERAVESSDLVTFDDDDEDNDYDHGGDVPSTENSLETTLEVLGMSDDSEYAIEEVLEQGDPEVSEREPQPAVDLAREETRSQLAAYLLELRSKQDAEGNPLVMFPEHFESVVNLMEMEHNRTQTDWMHYFVDDPVAQEEAKRQSEIERGLQNIKRLDLILARKTNEAKQIAQRIESARKAAAGEDSECENSAPVIRPTSTTGLPKEPMQSQVERSFLTEPKPKRKACSVSLTPDQEARIESILNDSLHEQVASGVHVPLGQGYRPTEADIIRLGEVESKLRELVPQDEWHKKGISTFTTEFDFSWKPT